MQEFGTILNDFVVIGIFIFLSLVLSGKIKLNPKKERRLRDLSKNKSRILRILVYGGTIIFTILLIHNLLGLEVKGSPSRWTDSLKKRMTEKCIKDAKESFETNPDGTTELCNCVIEKIAKQYTYEEAMEIDKLIEQDIKTVIMTIVLECKNETIKK